MSEKIVYIKMQPKSKFTNFGNFEQECCGLNFFFLKFATELLTVSKCSSFIYR